MWSVHHITLQVHNHAFCDPNTPPRYIELEGNSTSVRKKETRSNNKGNVIIVLYIYIAHL